MVEDLPGLRDTLAYCAVEGELEEHGDSSNARADAKLDFCRGDETLWLGACSLWANDKEVVYTDGACIRNQDYRFRRA
eukprot:3755247-Karenia_brevis.AAC.1